MAVLLLAPPLDVLSSWYALLQGSARIVFSDELFTYGNSHLPPFMWTRTPFALRLCIIVGLSVLIFARRWPRPLRLAALTIALVVGGVQLAALLRYLGLDAGLVDHLPRLHYFEFYTPLFYATCGGFALHYWHDLMIARSAGRRRISGMGVALGLVHRDGPLHPADIRRRRRISARRGAFLGPSQEGGRSSPRHGGVAAGRRASCAVADRRRCSRNLARADGRHFADILRL